MLCKEMQIINRLGLHARAAAKFVTLASEFASDIKVKKNNKQVNGKSIMGMMMLAAAKGSTIEICIDGSDESEAMKNLEDLIDQRFGEDA
ncbi:MAG: HPr family phosphocarrier protein [Gammaproteobacteria bacterium]